MTAIISLWGSRATLKDQQDRDVPGFVAQAVVRWPSGSSLRLAAGVTAEDARRLKHLVMKVGRSVRFEPFSMPAFTSGEGELETGTCPDGCGCGSNVAATGYDIFSETGLDMATLGAIGKAAAALSEHPLSTAAVQAIPLAGELARVGLGAEELKAKKRKAKPATKKKTSAGELIEQARQPGEAGDAARSRIKLIETSKALELRDAKIALLEALLAEAVDQGIQRNGLLTPLSTDPIVIDPAGPDYEALSAGVEGGQIPVPPLDWIRYWLENPTQVPLAFVDHVKYFLPELYDFARSVAQ